ncbi:hypothetical protein B0H13DRAFT_1850301 [Mycena leptocephala]|nr:hypothetical protein B0H13DRAFT_1850301 [Mycena leptocephala]
MLSDGARRLSSSLLSAALGEADSSFAEDKHGQNAANALENAIFTAAAGDLPAYQQIFRRIYLDLKTQRIEIQVIGRGGFTARFSLRQRSKISRVRAAVAQLLDDPTARFFWRSPAWRMLSDQDTPYSLCMGNRETVYYAGHIVVVHEIVTTTAHSKPSKSTFGVAPTYTLESLRKFFLPGYKQLLYAGKELGPTDTPWTLGTPNIADWLKFIYSVELNTVSPRFVSETLKLEAAELPTPPNTRYWTWSADTLTPGSVEITPQCKTRLRPRTSLAAPAVFRKPVTETRGGRKIRQRQVMDYVHVPPYRARRAT